MIGNRLVKFRRIWSRKTPRQKIRTIYNIADYSVRVVGVRVFTDDTRYWWTYSGYLSSFSYFLITIYTIVYHIQNNQFNKCFNCLCLSGMSVSVSSIQIFYCPPMLLVNSVQILLPLNPNTGWPDCSK